MEDSDRDQIITDENRQDTYTNIDWCQCIYKRIRPGVPHLVVLGVVVLAIVVSIMAVNWANLIYSECDSEIMVLAVLLTFQLIGVFCVIVLIYLRKTASDMNLKTKDTFLKIKLISMYIFGVGYLFHCGFYMWKHEVTQECSKKGKNNTIKGLGKAYNAISIIYTLFLFAYFAAFYVRKRENHVKENAASLGIIIANSCIWLDTLFSESDFLFKKHLDSNSSTSIFNKTDSSNRAIEAIEKTDPFLSPAMIEFSLMAIDLLFTKTDDSLEGSIPNDSRDVENDVRLDHTEDRNISTHNEGNEWKDFFKAVFQILLGIVSFALFAFTFTVVLTTESQHQVVTNTNDFNVYVVMQLILKFIILVLVTISLLSLWPFLTFHFNVSAFVLIVTCFGNIVYHMLYCFALHFEGNQKDEEGFRTASWADNIISIIIAGFQTLFILGFHSPKNYINMISKDWENFVYYVCSLLGVLNLGLWISDSIGEERLPIFSFSIYKAYEAEGWSVINKIILPLTIFFRFHSGLDLLEFYWRHRRSENKTNTLITN